MDQENTNEMIYADLFKQETGHTATPGIQSFLRRFSKYAELFRAWGVWDCRTGIIAQSRDQVRKHVRDYLTGGAFMDRLPTFAESLVDALTAAYQEGFEAVPLELIAQLDTDGEQ